MRSIKGYAVIMYDKSSPTGFWFVGIYNEREAAEIAAGRNKGEIIYMEEREEDQSQ
jgi:hypothetical protein